MSPSCVLPPRRVTLVMYDLPSDQHPGMRDWVKQWAGKEGEGWIRVQRSIILMFVRADADHLGKDVYGHWPGVESGRVMTVDVTSPGYGGRGDPKVWEWLARARKDARADLDRYNREKADQGLDELEKFANEGEA